MATYYVDFKNGSDSNPGTSGSPFKRPSKAHDVVVAGDTVKFRGNKNDATTYYPDSFSVKNTAGRSRNNTTWEADTGHTPTWDGGYTPTYGNWGSYSIPGADKNQIYWGFVSMKSAGVTFRGLRVQHSPMAGFGVGDEAHGGRVTECETFGTYGLSLNCNGGGKNAPTENVEIDNCEFLFSSLAYHAQGMKAANAVMLKFQKNIHFHHNVVAYGLKEGINIDKACNGVVFEYNIIHTMNHSGCLLYTSDGADDLLRVDLGGLPNIKKKQKDKKQNIC